MYKASDVASCIIEYCNKQEILINNHKLQALLYFTQVEFLGTSQTCFEDELVAWDIGPVVPRVYRDYAVYGNGNIPKTKIKTWASRIPEADQQRIQCVARLWRWFSGGELLSMAMRHLPWGVTYRPGGRGVISTEVIRRCIRNSKECEA